MPTSRAEGGETVERGPTGRSRARPRGAGLPDRLKRDWTARYAETDYRKLPWFSERESSWVRTLVVDQQFRTGDRVLDLGCGAGTNTIFLARHGIRATGVDVAPGAIDSARARAERAGVAAEFRTSDILQMPFDRASFDGAVDIGCFHTLPIRLRRGYAREVGRVLRPGGRLGLIWAAREYTAEFGPPHRPSVEEIARALEPEFIVARTEYRPEDGWPFASYAGLLERRKGAQPPPR